MASFYPSVSLSTRGCWEFSASRRRKRCTINRYFTKTGILVLLGVIILTSLPGKGSCRPVDDYVYGSSDKDVEDEEALGSRFEFQRKIVSKSSTSSSHDDVHSLEFNSKENSNENPLLNNSSMIVHVIVTSSSSTSSSELETDSEPHQDTIQYTVEVSEDGGGEPVDFEDGNQALVAPTLEDFNKNRKNKISDDNPPRHEPAADQLELKKLPKAEDDFSTRPVQDIFSAFYSAFTQQSSTLPSVLSDPENSDDFNSSITSFSLPSPYFRSRRLPQGFQSLQHRRRLFRNRQKQQERRSFSSTKLNDAPLPPEKDDKENAGDVEETVRKLEFLAKKLDNSEQNKILQASPSSVVETSSQVPYLFSSAPYELYLTPPKIAVSVAVSHSESGGKGEIHQGNGGERIRQRGVRKNAKSESALATQERSSNFHSASRTLSRIPSRRPKPLIKSLPKYEQDFVQGHNKNGSVGNNFVNFSAGRDERKGIYSGESFNRVNYTDDSPDGTSFRFLKTRHNIADVDDSDQTQDSFPRAESSSLIEITTSRPSPQRRKITRTVSAEIGDPSTYPFNLPTNNFHHSRKVVQTTPPSTPPPQPKVVNWQEPEKVWGEPAQVWGVPAKVWGEPERVWGEPAKVWGSPESVWQSTQKRTQIKEDEMMQSDQPQEDTGRAIESDDDSPQGTFVILGDDETEGDSIDGDLGRPLMLHHFTVPPKPKEKTVSISTSVSSSVSSTNNRNSEGVPQSRTAGYFPQKPLSVLNSQLINDSSNVNSTSFNLNDNNGTSEQKKSGKKFGYVIEGANVRKYRVEERTSDGYIVGEYGVLNNQNAFLRGVRYTADSTINPRLIHEALMKFLSLRRR